MKEKLARTIIGAALALWAQYPAHSEERATLDDLIALIEGWAGLMRSR